MANLDGTQTHANLKAAFAGESQANRRYLWMAKVADFNCTGGVAGRDASDAWLPFTTRLEAADLGAHVGEQQLALSAGEAEQQEREGESSSHRRTLPGRGIRGEGGLPSLPAESALTSARDG